MTSQKRIFIIIGVVVLVIILIAGYSLSRFVLTSHPTPYTPGTVASSTVIVGSVDTSSWNSLEEIELGFRVKYPGDWTMSSHTASGVQFTVPKITTQENTISQIKAGVVITPKACAFDSQKSSPQRTSESVLVNGVTFMHYFTTDNAAGNTFHGDSYSTTQNQSCYSIFLSYNVINPAVYNYPAEHQKQVQSNNAVTEENLRGFSRTFVSTFSSVTTPEGQNEADVTMVRINSITPSTASIGSIINLSGTGFNGHDTLLWISNASSTGSERGVLWGGMPTSDTQISARIGGTACHEYTGASGLPCSGSLKIVPGNYTLIVQNAAGKSNEAYIKIK